jgi:hypothetical protein
MSFFVGYLIGINGFFNERAMRGNRDNPGDPAAVVAVPPTIAVPSAHFLALLPLPHAPPPRLPLPAREKNRVESVSLSTVIKRPGN